MGVTLYTVKQHNLSSSSITTSISMKIAVLFSIVVLVVVASLKTAPAAAEKHCTCLRLIKLYKAAKENPLMAKDDKGNRYFTAANLKKGAKAACKGASAYALADIRSLGWRNCGTTF